MACLSEHCSDGGACYRLANIRVEAGDGQNEILDDKPTRLHSAEVRPTVLSSSI